MGFKTLSFFPRAQTGVVYCLGSLAHLSRGGVERSGDGAERGRRQNGDEEQGEGRSSPFFYYTWKSVT
jgi:hypothetical protein